MLTKNFTYVTTLLLQRQGSSHHPIGPKQAEKCNTGPKVKKEYY